MLILWNDFLVNRLYQHCVCAYVCTCVMTVHIYVKHCVSVCTCIRGICNFEIIAVAKTIFLGTLYANG